MPDENDTARQPQGLAGRATETWTHAGLRCAIVPNPHLGMFNGYVQLPDDHPDRHKHYDAIDVEVHGGLTYGPDKHGWVGFDTGHFGDFWAPDDIVDQLDPAALRYFGAAGIGKYTLIDKDPIQRRWTIPALRAEINRLAEQLAAWSQ